MPPSHTVGLLNLGNTCYMNSVLQALNSSRAFTNHLLSLPLTDESGLPLALGLQQVLAFLQLSLRSSYNPEEFRKNNPIKGFEDNAQKDCSEYLGKLLDTLQDQECQAPEQLRLVQRYFGIRVGSRLTCNPCRAVSSPEETDYNIRLAFPSAPSSSPFTLEKLLQHYLAPESIDGYKCKGCSRETTVTKATRLLATSQHLTITLNRYDQLTNKILSEVQLSRYLSLADFNQSRVDSPAASHSIQSGVDSPAARHSKQSGAVLPAASHSNQSGVDSPAARHSNQSRAELPAASHSNQSGVDSPAARHSNQSGAELPAASHSNQSGVDSPAASHSNQSGADSPAASQSELGEYRIYAVIIHKGRRLDEGHYYTWVRALNNRGDEVWRAYDDAEVTTHSWEDLEHLVRSGSEDTLYVLFYERVGGTVSGGRSPAPRLNKMVGKDNMQFASENPAAKMAAGYQGGNQAASALAGGGAGVSCGDSRSTIGAGRYVRLLASCHSA